MSDRGRALLVALAITLSLLAGSSPRIVGDGDEYVALALNFAALRGPAIAEEAIPDLQATIARYEPRLARWDIRWSRGGRDGATGDFVHFWFYPLLATPAVWVAQAVGASPIAAFAVLNLALLATALWICLPRLGVAVSLLLFCGPLVWWIDKPHTELFTVGLLSVAFTLVYEQPWWSMVAAGAAATQNPPIAVLLLVIMAIQLADNRAVLRRPRFWYGAAAGVALAALHPLYYLARYGTPSLLIRTTRRVVPQVAEWSAVLVDPSVGLLANFPAIGVALALAVVLLLATKPRELFAGDVTGAWIAAGVFLFSFGQSPNVHHGATPSLSRYALWLVPLTIPLLRRARQLAGRVWLTGVWSIAAVSAVICVFVFHPKVPEHSREPTLAATFLWTKHPTWNNPLPEVFIETLIGREENWVPVATPGCEKVLLRDRGDGLRWPVPCFPTPLPAWCAGPGALCYANLDGGRYRFAKAPAPRGSEYKTRRESVWPPAAERRVSKLFVEWQWWTLRLVDSPVLRSAEGVERAWVYEGAERFLFVALRPGPGASLALRLPMPMRGRLVDIDSDEPAREVQFDGPAHDLWRVPLPAGPSVVVVALEAMGGEQGSSEPAGQDAPPARRADGTAVLAARLGQHGG